MWWLLPAVAGVLTLFWAMYGMFFTDDARLSTLLSPAAVTKAMQRLHHSAVVDGVEVLELHRCGDGLASTTDRVGLRLTYAKGRSRGTGLPPPGELPTRVVAKLILLNPILRAGASEAVIGAVGTVSRTLDTIPIVGPAMSAGLWASMVLYQTYFPHAPDAMYRTEARVYAELHAELRGARVDAPACYGIISDDRSCT